MTRTVRVRVCGSTFAAKECNRDLCARYSYCTYSNAGKDKGDCGGIWYVPNDHTTPICANQAIVVDCKKVELPRVCACGKKIWNHHKEQCVRCLRVNLNMRKKAVRNCGY